MPVQGVPGMAVAAAAAGTLLVWSGLRGYSVTASLQSLITGRPPPHVQAHPITLTAFTGPATTGPGSPPGTAGGSTGSIAADALKYEGAGYVWGGAPAKGIGNWDCSSFVNWVVGHDLGMAIPGYKAGAYTGAVHGPTTLQWRLFGTSVPRSQVAAGDIVVWITHMGIVTGNNQMISAQNAQAGTRTSGIDGFIAGEPVTFRRL